MEQKELMEKQNFCETTVQESSGFLKNEGQKGVSAELLNGSIQPASEIEKDFTTRWESIEDLDAQKIQPFELIPDYLEPTSLLYPLVVKTPDTITCIEGWSMVQKARKEGQAVIRCYVHHLNMVSDIELSIRKTAIRIMPQAGEASYAEKMRNVAKTFYLIMDSNEPSIIFAHGGARRGLIFKGRRDENIRIVLAKRFGKCPTTITKYINHADYLSDEAMQVLVQAKADKGFFEDFQEAKMELVNSLKKQGVSKQEIVNRVSAEMIKIWNVSKKRRKKEIQNLLASLNPVQLPKNGDPSEMAKETQEEVIIVEEGNQPKEGSKEKGDSQDTIINEHSQKEEPFSEELRRKAIEVCEQLMQCFANREFPLIEIKKMLKDSIESLNEILAQIPEA